MLAYLGREFGLRSKRFALVAEGGEVRHVAVDEGADLLAKTSASALMPMIKQLDAAKAAEAAVAAELTTMESEAAYAYLSSSKTLSVLRKVGVPPTVLEKSRVIVAEAAGVEYTPLPATKAGWSPAPAAGAGDDAADSNQAVLGAVAALAIGFAAYSQQGAPVAMPDLGAEPVPRAPVMRMRPRSAPAAPKKAEAPKAEAPKVEAKKAGATDKETAVMKAVEAKAKAKAERAAAVKAANDKAKSKAAAKAASKAEAAKAEAAKAKAAA